MCANVTREAKIRSCTGHELFCSYWYPNKEQLPRAMVFISHGFGEYLVTYDRLVKRLLDANFLAFGHDHVGFGRSGGKRAQIDNVSQYVKDVECHAASVKAKLKDIPIFIVGHSMGGVIAVGTAIQNPNLFDGVILLSPGLAVASKFNTPAMRFLGRTLARIAPGAGLIQLEAEAITADTSIIEKYMKDPLIYKGRLKAKWLNAFRLGVDEIVKGIPDVKWPFLCIQAGNDPWIPALEIEKLMNTAQSPDKTVVIVPDALHRVFDEPNGVGDEVCRKVVEWIENHAEPES
ncbi:monoglyceride lipase-like [Paramacrobiotus metropolitanus]|uniref:monoglyceride lipase-like n=1 Tax=Paramacrobiotus metropolitanus TaxID=2943436 RepID=UPI0024460ABD|nr:monoglyceride lipase-like [Paramacrobiotus metropolitanus]XP_055350533.1 monoglyceride lipase-like [Paramacrobiotus metropolitanus]